jgi:hypothetical protein
MVIETLGKLIFRRPHAEIVKQLEILKFDKIDNDYAYLLQLPTLSYTNEQLIQLSNQINKKLETRKIILSKTPARMWIDDLNIFTKEYLLFNQCRHLRRESPDDIVRKRKRFM